MKQLIQIRARFLKSNDLIFDYKSRKAQKVEYVSHEKASEKTPVITNIHVSYGMDCQVADNFEPDSEVIILIETDDIEIAEVGSILH
jgi:hypothetical protein